MEVLYTSYKKQDFISNVHLQSINSEEVPLNASLVT